MIKMEKVIATIGIVGMLGSGIGIAQAALTLDEGFDGAIPPAGWTIINESMPVGLTDWFQGDPTVFTAQAGATNSYIAANFNAAGFGGNIDDWLLTPTVALHNGDALSFYTRTETGTPFPGDQLQVRLCKNGLCNTTASFTTVLLPTFAVPDAWTLESFTFSGLGLSDTGRIAFRYLVTDTANNGDYIGIDTVQLRTSVQVVPEPSTLLVVALGLATLGWRLRRNPAR